MDEEGTRCHLLRPDIFMVVRRMQGGGMVGARGSTVDFLRVEPGFRARGAAEDSGCGGQHASWVGACCCLSPVLVMSSSHGIRQQHVGTSRRL